MAAVPQVDVVPDGFDWANLIIGTGGLLIAVVAFLISQWVQRRASRSVIDERRRLFELEILRDLAGDLDQPAMPGEVLRNPRTLDRYRLRLDLLCERLPFWDQALAADDRSEIADLFGMGDRYRQLADECSRLSKIFYRVHGELVTVEGEVAKLEFVRSTATAGMLLNDQSLSKQAMDEWHRKRDRLKAEQDVASAELAGAGDRVRELDRVVTPQVAERLAHDLRQLIWSRVEDPRRLRHRS